MVDRARLLERLMATYLDELDEHVQTISDGVLALEKGLLDQDRKERLAELFRAAHSLKGASRAVDQAAIEQLCHVLEDVLGGIRDGRLQPRPDLCTLLLKSADTVGAAGQALRAKEPVNAVLLEQFQSAIQAAASGGVFEMPIAEPRSDASLPADSGHRSSETDDPEQGPPSAELAAAAVIPAPATRQSARAVEAATGAPGDAAPAESSIARRDESGSSAMPTDVESATTSATVKKTRASSTVRVAQEKLDALLAQSGELLVARQRVETHPTEIEALLEMIAGWKNDWQGVQRTLIRVVEEGGADTLISRSSHYATRMVEVVEANGHRLRELEKRLERLRRQTLQDTRQLDLVGETLQDHVHHIRMVPFAEACAGLERAVRDVATRTGKQVDLIVQGGDIEVDRSVITGLSDPLLHLVRNAVDHGVETPAERMAMSKPATAQVTVSVSLSGSQVQVVVADDGRGLDLDMIRESLRRRGIPEPGSERDLMNCVFLPGLSTAAIITDVSGRGVGMDVVKSQVEGLRGTIEISTQSGLGTRFTMLVPLTLTTISAVMVKVGDQTFLLPSSSVRKLVRFRSTELASIQGQETLSLGETPLPVVALSELLGGSHSVRAGEFGWMTGVIGQSGGREAVLVVDEVVSEREIVVKNLGLRIHRLPHVSGATLLQSGEISLLLTMPSLLRAVARGGASLSVSIAEPQDAPLAVSAQRLLVVDDSVTTRTLIRSILETAGYEVEAAVDGQDAWDRLQNSSDGFALVISDVDMPGMSGFQLTETIRASDRFQNLPVVLVTSRGSDDDKTQGVRSGASAYLIKSQFDQSNILETVEQLI